MVVVISSGGFGEGGDGDGGDCGGGGGIHNNFCNNRNLNLLFRHRTAC